MNGRNVSLVLRAAAAIGTALAGCAVTAAVLSVPAGATTSVSTPSGTISATSSPMVPSTGTGKTAGSLTVGFSAAGSLGTGETLQLRLSPTTGSGIVDWNSYSVSTIGITAGTIGAGGSLLGIVLGPKANGTAATVNVTDIKYTTSGAGGDVTVTPDLTGVMFSPSSASNATLVQTPPSAPALSLVASSQPHVSIGQKSASVGTWTLAMTGNSTSGAGWAAGDTLLITVTPPSGTNCVGNDSLYFSGTPSASVGATSGITVSPSLATSLVSSGTCTSAEPNRLEISFTNDGWFDSASTGGVRIDVSGIHYSVGSTTAGVGAGAVNVTATFSVAASSVVTTSASNATVGGLTVAADTPPVSVVERAYDAPISPVSLIESASAHVAAGYVCLTLTGASFNTTAAPTVTVSAGNGVAGSTVAYQQTGSTGAAAMQFQVSVASTSVGEYTVSGAAIDAGTTPGPVDVTATEGTSSSCTNDTESIGWAGAFTVVRTPVTRIFGSTADATAAAELEHQFGAVGTACPGRPGSRPVVLATDANYPDALASAYLASSLGTGELLTPTGSLSEATANALRVEGVTNVYIVGGPLAVSTAVTQELQASLAYDCGGATPITSNGPVHIAVTRIFGATQYDTAQWVAEFPNATQVGTLDVTGAYAGTNRTGGSGKYNDGAGNASSSPATSATLPTAILATGTAFQDAESASVLSYADHLPILLTTPTALSPQATSAIVDLGIKQVIVMGGQLAVSDAVVTSLKSLGTSVLRVAGIDATDTAAQLADFEMATTSSHLGLGWAGNGGTVIARGDYYSDGLAGAIVAAGAGRTHAHGPEPLVLTETPTTVGQYLAAFLSEAGRTGIDRMVADKVSSLTILGGPYAISKTAAQAMIADL